MIKTKKLLLLTINLILFILLVKIVYSVNVGVIMEFEDGTIKTDCVNVPQETDGFEILEKSVFDILWSPSSVFGQLVCKINDEGTEISGNFCEFSGSFWNFNILPEGGNEWIHSPVGHNGPGGCWNRNILSFGGHYCGIDKDVIGYDFGSGGDEPPLKTYEQVCEKLKVKDISVYVDGKKEAGADEEGGKIDVVPGSKIELTIKIENLYSDNEDVEIEDVSVEATLESIDDGNDIEATANDFDLNAGKDKEIVLEFNIPLEVEDGDYDLIIEIEGGNERGFPYSKIIEFEVEVEKEKHDVVFNRLEFSNNNVECGNAAKLNVGIVNVGTNDENAKLGIVNQDLGIDIQESFKLSEDSFDKENSFAKFYIIKLPQDAVPGKYIFLADLVSENDIERSNAELNVECSNFMEKEKSENSIAKATGHVSELNLQSKTQQPYQENNIKNENSFNNPIIMSLMIFSAIAFTSIIALLLYLLKI